MSVKNSNSGWGVFFIEKPQIRPVPCRMKSYDPKPTAKRSAYLGFHAIDVT